MYLNILTAKIFLTTTPDIGNNEVPLSKKINKYCYIFHSAASTHKLYNKNAFFKGYGEILSKAPKLPNFSIILINPIIELSTKKVFLKYDKNFLFNKKNNTYRLNNKNFYSWILKNNNDLLMPAKKIVPEIGEMLSFLDNLENCLLSRMTGSGPTVFGLFKNSVDARNANKIFKKEYPNWWSKVTSLKS